MLPKVAHYAGFQSYSQTPYPHLKLGKEQKKEHNKYHSSTPPGSNLKWSDPSTSSTF